ncbi:MAG: hypothetical protein IJ005_09840 [Bacteroidales bacterium]|nr:hypothetical protein [Bacteroidales bacterium]
MSRFNRILSLAAVVLMAASCGNKAKVDMSFSMAPSSDFVVKLLNVNHFEVLDTVKTNDAGRLSFDVEVKKEQPEFVYVFYKDVKVASLLLEAGDRVNVEADTLGNYQVSGSEESAKLAQVDKDYVRIVTRFNEIARKMDDADAARLQELKRQLGQEYLAYYRSRVKYVMENSFSLTSVPVLFQSIGENLPVFGQTTDAIHFTNTADSLEIVYPDSKYVKALRNEAKRRYGLLELEHRVNAAEEVGYFDIELPDMNAKMQKLSEVDAKAVLVYFWNPSDGQQKMFNQDVLKWIYDDFAPKGLQIYQIAIEPDKAAWARVVKGQALPWINVCDARGASSPYVSYYNLTSLPAAFIISDDTLTAGPAADEKSIRKALDKIFTL